MGKKEKRSGSGSQGEVVTRQAEDGSFEIIVTDEEGNTSTETMATRKAGTGAPGPQKSRKVLVVGGVAGAVCIVAVGLVFALGSGDNDGPATDAVFEQAPAFQPYGGGSARVEEPEESDQGSTIQARAAIIQKDDDSDEDEVEEPPVVDDWRLRENDITREAPDGVRVVEDSRGEPMSRREAQIRAEKELDAMENSEHDFERRLRRRDTALNSRVFQPGADGNIEIAPGVKMDDAVRSRVEQRLQQRPQMRQQLVEEDGDYGAYYDDEYYEDDEYYDDGDGEYYDDEIWED